MCWCQIVNPEVSYLRTVSSNKPLKNTRYKYTSTDDTTKIRPSRLNQAVSQPQNFPPRIEPQWYKPPAVGYAEAICPMLKATNRLNRPPTNQPTNAPPPPVELKAAANEEIPPARMQMIENEIAKFENP